MIETVLNISTLLLIIAVALHIVCPESKSTDTRRN